MAALSRPHYANVILIGHDGKHLSTISDKKAKWYLERNLAAEITAPAPYARALKLNFVNKQTNDSEVWDLAVTNNQCVICGTGKELTLHHIVPRVIRRYFPVEIKGHSREWCVLLCESCHTHVEFVSQPIYKTTFPDYKRGEKDMNIALQVIKSKGNLERIPGDKLQEMFSRSDYNTIEEIPELTSLDKQTIHVIRGETQQALIREWAENFIKEQGGIEGTQQYFLNLFLTFNPKYLPEWFADLKKQVT